MLVLSRKVGEQIRIGTDVIVSISEIRGDKVRLAVTAPKLVGIHREEVYQRIQNQGEQDVNGPRY